MAVDDAQPSLAERLGGSIVGTRLDLEVSRHVFRDAVAYLVRDPLTTSVHRLGPREYRMFNAMTDTATLAETCAQLQSQEHLAEGEAESFYRFVLQMHKLGFLKLPIQEGDGLYQRHLSRAKAKKKARLMWIYSAQIPVCNPDRFLNATVRYAKPIFSPLAVIAWTLLVALAMWTGLRNVSEFSEPAMNIFSGPNLPLLWITLVGLKVVHEFGHAYACKLYGGRVPEMGVMLIAGAPLAYMDATSSWSFPSKKSRIVVCLAGMYVEVGLAAVALLMWTVTPPGVLRSVLHNVVMLASITTVVMNINPLMRYDGYYALTDALEMPNLRGRATNFSMALLRRVLLGLELPKIKAGLGLRIFYVTFGIASAVYKVTIVLSISAAIASKFLIAGTLLGGIYILNSLWGITKKSVPYLAKSPETAPMRLRAVSVLLVCFGLLPLALFAVPIPATVAAPGLMAQTDDVVLRAETAGFLEQLFAAPGDRIAAGDPVALLADPGLGKELSAAQARQTSATIRARVNEPLNASLAEMEGARRDQAAQEVAHWQARAAMLRIGAPQATQGRFDVLTVIEARDLGRWIPVGEALATLTRVRQADEGQHALALFDAADLAGTQPEPGSRAWFQPQSTPGRKLPAHIVRVTPAGSRKLSDDFLEHLNVAELAVNPVTGETGQTQFVVEIELDPGYSLPAGSTGRLRLRGEPAPIGLLAIRKTLVFLAKL